ncbi:threonylcarbamoyl-AMP synthase [Candidatus Curtissbacteria bacterium]|nr:threonylcarbamoyl-AMP synthase [Candidatus Curtissbacteria bacterium]
MKKQEGLKLTGEVKIKKTSHVILSVSEGSFKKATRILKSGGVVIFPTDTIYGIGCRFDNPKAIERIYSIKGTPKNQPFPILIADTNQIGKIAKVDQKAQRLIEKYWPGGLTIILMAKKGNQKIGFRMPDSELVLALINKVGVPIIGTSANFHGQPTQTSFEELNPKIVKKADFVLKGECKLKVESTVVDATVDPPRILRKGAVSLK